MSRMSQVFSQALNFDFCFGSSMVRNVIKSMALLIFCLVFRGSVSCFDLASACIISPAFWDFSFLLTILSNPMNGGANVEIITTYGETVNS